MTDEAEFRCEQDIRASLKVSRAVCETAFVRKDGCRNWEHKLLSGEGHEWALDRCVLAQIAVAPCRQLVVDKRGRRQDAGGRTCSGAGGGIRKWRYYVCKPALLHEVHEQRARTKTAPVGENGEGAFVEAANG